MFVVINFGMATFMDPGVYPKGNLSNFQIYQVCSAMQCKRGIMLCLFFLSVTFAVCVAMAEYSIRLFPHWKLRFSVPVSCIKLANWVDDDMIADKLVNIPS